MLTKENIQQLKSNGSSAIKEFIAEYEDAKSLVQIFEWLGRLPSAFDGDFIIDYLQHKNVNVRIWAVKTLGKLANDSYIEVLKDVAFKDLDTSVRREAVSSIGRLKSEKAKKVLIAFLKDKDPKIVCQAIRGLLVFKGQAIIDEELKKLINHENETVEAIVRKEYFSSTSTKSNKSHSYVRDELKNAVVNGDTIKIMAMVPDESVHLTFTSPPYYNARDYSIYPSYEHYLEFLTETFKQVHRITKEGRFLVINTSPVIVPRISRAYSSKRYPIPFDIHHYLTNIGWEFIDDIIWLKPEASVKNRVGGFMQHRKPLGYKPNSVTEYLMVYRKKTDKLLDWNIKSYREEVVNSSKISGDYDSTNVWRIDPSYSKSHSAVFPSELCRRVIQYYSYKGDLVFDPFGGSGTVADTATKLERFFFLTELDKKYFEYIKSRDLTSLLHDEKPSFYSEKKFRELMASSEKGSSST